MLHVSNYNCSLCDHFSTAPHLLAVSPRLRVSAGTVYLFWLSCPPQKWVSTEAFSLFLDFLLDSFDRDFRDRDPYYERMKNADRRDYERDRSDRDRADHERDRDRHSREDRYVIVLLSAKLIRVSL